MKIVVDTSSLISYALTKGDIMVQIMNAWEMEELQVVFSPQTFTELLNVLDRPYIKSRSGRTKSWLLGRIDKYAVFVQGVVGAAGASRDPQDDMFLACAVEGQVHYLVSSDNDLLDMGQYEGICILNPGQFLVAMRLSGLSAEEMKAQFSQKTLAAIQYNLCLEPETAVKLSTALK